MSAPAPSSWLCVPLGSGYGLLLLASLLRLATGKQGNCSHPLVPEHGGFRCEPSPCRGFPQKSSIHYFCEPGYAVPSKLRSSKCRHGRWTPAVPACLPLKEGRLNYEDRVVHSLPSVATTAVGVSIFLLTTTACMVIKSRLYPCHSQNRRSSDQLDLMADGLPVVLPSYEEAVYGSWGQRLPPCAGPGPTQLLLAQEAQGLRPSAPHGQSEASLQTSQSPDVPPPPYEEVQSRAREGRSDGAVHQLQVTLSDDKNT